MEVNKNILGELFAPGNVDRVYDAEVKKLAAEQAEYIRDSLMKNIIEPAARNNVPLVGYLSVIGNHIYAENMEALRACGVRVFRYAFFWYDPKYGPTASRQKSSVRHVLVWDPELADDFENRVLKPEIAARCPAVQNGYDFAEL